MPDTPLWDSPALSRQSPLAQRSLKRKRATDLADLPQELIENVFKWIPPNQNTRRFCLLSIKFNVVLSSMFFAAANLNLFIPPGFETRHASNGSNDLDVDLFHWPSNYQTFYISRNLALKVVNWSKKLLIPSYIPIVLGALPNLVHLNLSRCNLRGKIPDTVGNLTLKSLNLSHNHLSGPIPSSLSNLSASLYTLNISENNLTGPFDALCSISNLAILSIARNPLSCEIPSAIAKLEHLLELSLHDCDLQGPFASAILELTCLERLMLNGNKLGGRVPRGLMEMPRLQICDLRGNEFVEVDGPVCWDWK
ncbi:hypothetical protein BC830DRAFT_1085106 [Chytriomyces sp. MP71]|nr:hypothetical protein BC830DRAFT_1085106 [Chytriomyces sp. MP71]